MADLWDQKSMIYNSQKSCFFAKTRNLGFFEDDKFDYQLRLSAYRFSRYLQLKMHL